MFQKRWVETKSTRVVTILLRWEMLGGWTGSARHSCRKRRFNPVNRAVSEVLLSFFLHVITDAQHDAESRCQVWSANILKYTDTLTIIRKGTFINFSWTLGGNSLVDTVNTFESSWTFPDCREWKHCSRPIEFLSYPPFLQEDDCFFTKMMVVHRFLRYGSGKMSLAFISPRFLGRIESSSGRINYILFVFLIEAEYFQNGTATLPRRRFRRWTTFTRGRSTET